MSARRKIRRNQNTQSQVASSIESLESKQLLTSYVIPIDGVGNNIDNPDWGAAHIELLRTAPPEYTDFIGGLARGDAASPRRISNLVSDQQGSITNDRMLTDFVWQWGQFLDHDIDLTPETHTEESAPIAVPSGDVFFDPFGTGSQTINLTRSAYAEGTGDSPLTPRQHLNEITAFIDGSNVYGSDAERAAALRTFVGGRLKTSAGDLLPFNTEGLPNAGGPGPNLFLAGDIRANEQVGLATMHTLFVREHNWWADRIAGDHPDWNDEQVYQAARQRVIAELQAITYNEFLPALLGDSELPDYVGYQADVNPSISNEFATASYRFGHSMLSPQLLQLDATGNPVESGHLALRDAFFRPDHLITNGLDATLRGLATQLAQQIDNHLVDDVRNFLFGPPGSGGFDLASLNIQRGREHGLADYNSLRVAYGLDPVETFADITSSIELQDALELAYGHVHQIDPWVGGLCEDHLPGSSLGELLTAVLSDQFIRLRDGDRFWYQNVLDTQTIADVEATTLSDIILRNTGITELQDNVFLRADAQLDDHGESTYQASSLFVGSLIEGSVEFAYDTDWMQFFAVQGETYAIEVQLDSLSDSTLTLFAADGTTELSFNDDAFGLASYLEWTADQSGPLFAAVGGYADSIGSYSLSITRIDDFADNSTIAHRSEQHDLIEGRLDRPFDVDWVPINLKANQTYSFNASQGLVASIYDATGTTLLSRLTTYSHADSVRWTPNDDGSYLLRISAENEVAVLDYQVSLHEASFGPGNVAPSIGTIGDQTLLYHDDSVVIELDISDYEGTNVITSAFAVADIDAYDARETFQLRLADNDWYNWGGRQEKWLSSWTGHWYFLTPDGTLHEWDRSPSASGSAVAQLDPSYHSDLNSLIEFAANDQLLVELDGSLLSIKVNNELLEPVGVIVRADDGLLIREELFYVSRDSNRAPVIEPMPTVDLRGFRAERSIHIPVHDADLDPLYYTVDVEHPAYNLDQQYGFFTAGDFYEDWGGRGEKWFQGTGSQWYFITPDGNIYRWNRLSGANGDHLATLDEIYHRDIHALLDAVPADQLAEATMQGGMLQLRSMSAQSGQIEVQLTVSDREYATTESLHVNVVNNEAPTLDLIDDVILTIGTSQDLVINADDADQDELTVRAAVANYSEAALVAQQLGLQYTGSDHENWGGIGEKWLRGSDQAWYYITTGGSLYRWDGQSGALSGELITTLDSAYHADMSLLYNANRFNAPLQFAVTESGITLTSDGIFRGFVFVELTVSDHLESTTQLFRVQIK